MYKNLLSYYLIFYSSSSNDTSDILPSKYSTNHESICSRRFLSRDGCKSFGKFLICSHCLISLVISFNTLTILISSVSKSHSSKILMIAFQLILIFLQKCPYIQRIAFLSCYFHPIVPGVL